jgi:hypothetical protein
MVAAQSETVGDDATLLALASFGLRLANLKAR